MQREHTDRTGYLAALIGLFALLLGVVFGFVGVGVWWIESRFGSNMAAGVLIALLALTTATGAALLTHRIVRRTNEANADMIASITDAMRARASVDRGYAAVDAAHAKMQLLDHQQVLRLADQRSGLLVDLAVEKERQKQAPAAAPVDSRPAWLTESAEAAGPRFLA